MLSKCVSSRPAFARRMFFCVCFSLRLDEDEDDLEEEHVTKVRGRVLCFVL